MVVSILLTQRLPIITSSLAGTPPGATYAHILQPSGSNDVQGIIRSLPQIETLWPLDPEAYIRSVNQAANLLGAASNSADARQALVKVFEAMMQKSCPSTAPQAICWVRLKCDAILNYLNFQQIRTNEQSWLEIAKFIGEMRSQTIPNYRNEGFLHAPGVLDQSPQRARDALEKNERNKIADNLQQLLRTKSTILTFHLLHNCSRLGCRDPKRGEFVQQIVSSAHLSGDEQRQLR